MVDPHRRHRPRPAEEGARLPVPALLGRSRKGGTGLGLAIAADLVRNHGGRLELLRSDEDGTQFILHLPRELAIPVSRAEIA